MCVTVKVNIRYCLVVRCLFVMMFDINVRHVSYFFKHRTRTVFMSLKIDDTSKMNMFIDFCLDSEYWTKNICCELAMQDK